MITLCLDTDIGTDVDDLEALALLLGSPECFLASITTVYGDTELRARMVSRAYALLEQERPPIAAGLGQPMSGRPVWWAGHEGASMPDLAAEPFDAALDAVEILRRSEVIAAIGPLTNVAAAITGPHRITELILMAGDFGSAQPEHNLLSDVTAAQAVFGSAIRATVTGIEQTERVVLSDDQIAELAAAGAFGTVLVEEIRRFRSWLGRPDSPHDAVAVLAALRPELFEFAVGVVEVDAEGRTALRPDPGGPHRVVTDLDAGAVAAEIHRRILCATRG